MVIYYTQILGAVSSGIFVGGHLGASIGEGIIRMRLVNNRDYHNPYANLFISINRAIYGFMGAAIGALLTSTAIIFSETAADTICKSSTIEIISFYSSTVSYKLMEKLADNQSQITYAALAGGTIGFELARGYLFSN